jgi:hypothetical protein
MEPGPRGHAPGGLVCGVRLQADLEVISQPDKSWEDAAQLAVNDAGRT